jgi:UDP-2-acetamido-3-amino-2,3-dideoxy-glucuronate N-acetyltransferase
VRNFGKHHDTAIIDDWDVKTASVLRPGALGATVWAHAHIRHDADIGTDTMIGEGAHVGVSVKIGDRCRIQNGVQLFEGVQISDDVFIGPHVVFTNVLTPRAFVPRRDAFKTTIVEKGVSIGANATILCGITLGQFCMVGAGAVVTKTVRPFELVYGGPAKHRGWVCRCGLRHEGFFDMLHASRACPCGLMWRRTEKGVEQL